MCSYFEKQHEFAVIILEQPYISQFLTDTIGSLKISVLDTELVQQLAPGSDLVLIDEQDAIQQLELQIDRKLYTTSENALEWVVEKLPATDFPKWVELFKNKVNFRQLISKLYPDFYFKEVAYNDLNRLNIDKMAFPFIIKPSIGFFSMGVKKVDSAEHWSLILKEIDEDIKQVKGLYPEQVLNASHFIIEQYIEGDEYAFDAYFDENGEPVILGIYRHIFSSTSDVSDRIYYTSREIIQENLDSFNLILKQIAQLASIRNFPLHVEVRKDSQGTVIPIEVNPVRFGGWCSTADLTYHAYGFNPYEYYFHNKIPDWGKLLTDKEDIYSIIILDNSTGLDAEQIKGFDYEKLLKQFDNPLELRKIDYHQYPLFGFLFTQTKQNNFAELDAILKSDLNEFIVLP